MKHYFLASMLIMTSNYALANSAPLVKKERISPNQYSYTLSRSHSELNRPEGQKRTVDFPTQVIRVKTDLSNNGLSCDEIFDEVKSKFTAELFSNDIAFGSSFICWFEVKEEKAHKIALSLYFDPETDEAVDLAQHYIAQYNGTDFYGVPFNIEPAKGLVVNLGMSFLKEDDGSIFKPFSSYKNSLYFNNVYEMSKTLIADINNKMKSNNSELINSFMSQWLALETEESSFYLSLLSASDMVSFSPELVFLLDTQPKAYSPYWSHYYIVDCKDAPNQKCFG